MKFVLTTFGSTGNINPIAALGVGLQNNGHQVTVVAPEIFKSAVESSGLTFFSIGDSYSFEDIKDVTTKIIDTENALLQAQMDFEELVEPYLLQWVKNLERFTKDADAIISETVQPAGMIAAELSGIPWISLQINYCCIPFWGYPPEKEVFQVFQFPNILGYVTNCVNWAIVLYMLRRTVSAPVNRVRRSIGLKSIWNPAPGSKFLDIVAVSPLFIPQHESWPSYRQAIGHLRIQSDKYAEEIRDPKYTELYALNPIVVTLGSMTPGNPIQFTEHLIEASNGRPMIIQSGWGKLSSVCVPENVAIVNGYIDHERLFRKACVVVHHGGSGTFATALRCGTPQIILPQAFDQPLWGKLAEKHRIGLCLDKNGAGLKQAICTVASSPDMRRTAASLQSLIAKEDATQAAVRLIEDRLSRISASSPGE